MSTDLVKLDRYIRSLKRTLDGPISEAQRHLTEDRLRQAIQQREFLVEDDSETSASSRDEEQRTSTDEDTVSQISLPVPREDAEFSDSEPGSSPNPRLAQLKLKRDVAEEELRHIPVGTKQWKRKMDEIQGYDDELDTLAENAYELERRGSGGWITPIPTGRVQIAKRTIRTMKIRIPRSQQKRRGRI